MQSDERLRIETPEQVTLELPIAGIGSRFIAVAIDTVLQMILSVAAVFAAIMGLPALGGRVAPALGQLGPALAILILFCVYWGYFAFFETIWSGRTPGKRLVHIRVVKESGRAINVYEAIARNVLRAIDFLPGFYGLGVVVMMFNRNSRRIGDYVAATLVVHDRPAAGMPLLPSVAGAAPVPADALARLTADELVLIETYLQRREDLEWVVRERMADQIAERILLKAGLQRGPGTSIDDFLESIARRIRDVGRAR